MLTRRMFLTSATALPVATLVGQAALAASPEVLQTNGVAINGYDPVAYFTDGQPVEGTKSHALKWMGVVWLFSSQVNMATFEADPHEYAPQYGGYCAYAMSKNAVATTVPEAWTIHKGKLYLNFSTGVRDIWRKDVDKNIALADGYWPGALQN